MYVTKLSLAADKDVRGNFHREYEVVCSVVVRRNRSHGYAGSKRSPKPQERQHAARALETRPVVFLRRQTEVTSSMISLFPHSLHGNANVTYSLSFLCQLVTFSHINGRLGVEFH